jgi:ADP-ribose pyrophosphatase YjhB (NUDIX family)
MRHSHCSFCGAAYAADAGWPRTCAVCGETTWHNPLPVAVALLPVLAGDAASGDGARAGIVAVRRAIEPGYGQLGLPGGFVEVGESWQEAAVRELREETGIAADPAAVRLFDVHSTPTGHSLLVFGLLPAVPAAELPPVKPTDEALEWLVLTEPCELVFSTHTRALADYFASA